MSAPRQSATSRCGRMLPQDAPLLADIFRASIEELTEDDYSAGAAGGLGVGGRRRGGVRRAAWQAADADRHAWRLAGRLCLARRHDRIDMLYVHPAAAGQGAGKMLCDALEKLAAARGATRAHRRGERHRARLLRAARLCRAAAQHGLARRRMAGQHHDGKTLAHRRKGARHETPRHAVPAPLALLHRCSNTR